MIYVGKENFEYIKSKYVRPTGPVERFYRFQRADGIYEEDSGLAPDKIYEGIEALFENTKTEPHPVCKAKAFAYVLDNTRINCDIRDRYPAINMIDRPLHKIIINEWNREVFRDIVPELAPTRHLYESNGVCTTWPDYDHSVPVWKDIFSLGFKGLRDRAESVRGELQKERTLTEEENAFFESIKITYDAILRFVERCRLQAENQNNLRLAAALKNIGEKAPETFYEAMLTDYIYFMLCEHIQGLQVRSLSGFDDELYRFFKADMEKGVTEEELRVELAFFFAQFAAIDNYWGQPVFIGGTKEYGGSLVNELSYVFLDVYDKMGIHNPKVQIKVGKNTPKAFLEKALDMIRRGNNCIVFVSDELIQKSLISLGATPEQARTADVKGCYEYAVKGAYGSGMNYFNLVKPIEFMFHEGKDGLSGADFGLTPPALGSFATFDEFYNEYKRQLKFHIGKIMETVNVYEDYLAYINPQPMLAATCDHNLYAAKDPLEGGAVKNCTSMAFGFLGDAADSLAMIKKYVFDKKLLTLTELKDILDSNFEGNEEIRLLFHSDPDKYGNNRDLPDFFASDIADFCKSVVVGRPNAKKRNGFWTVGFHVARMSYTFGLKTLASPNGRRLGEELSKNCSASMGQNKEGPTSAILSVTKINAVGVPGDVSLDLGIHPTTVKGDVGLQSMYALLMTFIDRGGHAMHINVFDAETLRAAQKDPEMYSDLQIRVCGWNVLWNNINKTEQDGFIRQAEGLV